MQEGAPIMLRMLRSIRVVMPMLLITTACGKSSTVSPVAPSSPSLSSVNIPGPAAIGTTIVGIVNLGASIGTQTAGSGLTVGVIGTTISSPTDTSGHFELKDVPSGTVHLRFTGVSVNAGMAIAAVTENERIQVAVVVSGSTATLITIERTALASADAEVEGAVSNVSGSCPSLTFVVSGKTIMTTASTQFKDSTCGSIAAGRRVEVKGTVQANGTILATRLELEENEVQPEVELKGAIAGIGGSCPNVTLSVNGTSIITSPATQFKNGSCASLRSGVKIEVKGARQANGSVLASKVEIDH
jgi:hypothetical protein